jgi:hypothetical protein
MADQNRLFAECLDSILNIGDGSIPPFVSESKAEAPVIRETKEIDIAGVTGLHKGIGKNGISWKDMDVVKKCVNVGNGINITKPTCVSMNIGKLLWLLRGIVPIKMKPIKETVVKWWKEVSVLDPDGFVIELLRTVPVGRGSHSSIEWAGQKARNKEDGLTGTNESRKQSQHQHVNWI